MGRNQGSRVSAAAAEAVKAAEAAIGSAAETAVAVADGSTADTVVAAELTAETVAAAPEEAGATAVVESAPAPDAPVFAEPAISPVDEDSILEELMRGEEVLGWGRRRAEPGLSVEDLGSFTLDDVEIGNRKPQRTSMISRPRGPLGDGIDESPIELGALPVLTPDAGRSGSPRTSWKSSGEAAPAGAAVHAGAAAEPPGRRGAGSGQSPA